MPSKYDNSLSGELEESLKNKLTGEVHFDRVSKILYSTDASNYEIEPVGVAVPKNEDDVGYALEIASKYNVAVLPRGSGSSLAGQAVGHALVLDLSKYMNRVLEVNNEEKTVRVEPGIFLGRLNKELKRYGLKFGPDPSSARIATVGGVVGNNATGAHSILYGMAGDNVEACRLFLNKGESIDLSVRPGIETLSKQLQEFKDRHSDRIKDRFPRHWRRASGYSLNYFLDNKFNPAKIIAGSEGTLGTATELTLKLVECPAYTALAIIEFDSIVGAMEAVPAILETDPSAVELIDKYLIDLTRKSKAFSRMLTFVEGDSEAILIVEFDGQSEAGVETTAKYLGKHLKSKNIKCVVKYALSTESQYNVWEVRRAGLGLLMSKRSEFKPVPCIEDVSVPVDTLPGYVEDINGLLRGFDTEAGFYGHASAGCLHIRPLINLKTKSGIKIMEELTEESFKLALKYGGVMSGEHGDGLQRSYLNEHLFGEELYGVMEELKAIFDPEGIFNPGKIVNSGPPSENLRYGESYRTQEIKTYLKWPEKDGFASEVEMCNGQGVCRKLDEGIMCPSYMATRNELDTTRARANILRAVISGKCPPDTITSDEMHRVFDLCISCKACKSECPSRVDAAKMKLEFLGHYHAERGFSLRDKLFGYVHNISKLSSIFKPISSITIENFASRWALSGIGVAKERQLPKLSNENFTDWFKNRPQSSKRITDNKIVYFHDTWVSYYNPEIGMAAVKVLESAGFEVLLVEQRSCCGRPMLSKGMIEQASKRALKNVSALSGYVNRGIPVVGTEPSCILTFRDEYLDLLPDNNEVLALSKNSYLLDEFLLNLYNSGKLDISWKDNGPEVFYHAHCHQRSLIGNEASLKILSLAGCKVTESEAGCCGMAGSFGYESEHYKVSKRIADERLVPAVNKASSDMVIAVSGISCKHQIEDFTDKKTMHIAQVLDGQIV